MVGKATKNGHLRSTMKHPVTGDDPGNNVGENIPDFTYKFVEGKDLQITYVAKGGGRTLCIRPGRDIGVWRVQ